MKNEPYIRAGNNGIDLYYVFSLLDYEDLPIVFVARDENWQIYLCDCTEFRFSEQRWTIAKTTPSVIRDIITHRMSVFSSLNTLSDSIILAECDLESDRFSQTIIQFDRVPDNRLPAKDSVLSSVCEGATENLSQFEAEYRTHAAKPTPLLSGSFDGAQSFSDIRVVNRVQIPSEWAEDNLSAPSIVYNNSPDSFRSSYERDEAA